MHIAGYSLKFRIWGRTHNRRSCGSFFVINKIVWFLFLTFQLFNLSVNIIIKLAYCIGIILLLLIINTLLALRRCILIVWIDAVKLSNITISIIEHLICFHLDDLILYDCTITSIQLLQLREVSIVIFLLYIYNLIILQRGFNLEL